MPSVVPYVQPDEQEEDDPGGLRDFLTQNSGVVVPAAQAQAPQAAGTVAQATASNPGVPVAAQATVPPSTVSPQQNGTSLASRVPTYTAPDDDMLQALIQKKNTDSAPVDRKANGPKWYERLEGGLAAGAMAFGHVPGAVEAGQAVTNRRMDQAQQDRSARIAQDDAGIQQYKDQADQQAKDYERQLSGYRAGLEGSRADEERSN